MRMVGGHATDIYYVPKRFLQAFSKLATLFSEHFIFTEPAVTTINSCVEDIGKTLLLRGLNVWNSDTRNLPWLNFSNFKKRIGSHFYHPVKWTPLLINSVRHKDFLCQEVLPFLHPPSIMKISNQYT